MRGAIESAALVVDKRWRVRSKPEVFQNLSDPLKISPSGLAHSARPLKSPVDLDFTIFISLGTRRAKCKKLVLDRTQYEFALKMQASTPLFL